MPLWLAPNMVTLIGFFFIIANVALLAIYMPDLVGPVCFIPFLDKRLLLLHRILIVIADLSNGGSVVAIL